MIMWQKHVAELNVSYRNKIATMVYIVYLRLHKLDAAL
jgi:hypothetical protein